MSFKETFTRIKTKEEKVFEKLGIEEPPRLRGIALLYTGEDNAYTELGEMFKGKEYMEIQTRCGGDGYEAFGLKEWEEKLNIQISKDCFFDSSFRHCILDLSDLPDSLLKELTEL